ncbi:MAG TPA: cupin domain-containing protein [Actinophytocola sp.]|uniref:JmjC domain-containing protein n=1 Tax=Actinophytocola sp. TaxID=1872138 RepID=UPI002DBA32BE|nr:cupin domain-containing protein [Actinophytocola sp.]HEU5469197.1 cupin domain-containing protein [Actinophytocola sp.]
MDIVHPLARLVDEMDLATKFWNARHGLFKGAVPTDRLITENDIQDMLDAGLLRWPYFTLLKEGQQPELSAFTTPRKVAGQYVKGFADARKVRELLADGATMKLSQLEDWHQPIRAVMDAIEARLPAELKAYVFYTPCDNTGMLPHRDGSHVLALQLAGAKEWTIYDAPDQIDSRPGLDVDPNSRSHTFVMEPGDVLYLPHGFPHVATARGGTSLHLTLTITEPGPADLVEAFLTTFAGEIAAGDALAADTVAALRAHLEFVDSRVLVDTAVATMRKRTV